MSQTYNGKELPAGVMLDAHGSPFDGLTGIHLDTCEECGEVMFPADEVEDGIYCDDCLAQKYE